MAARTKLMLTSLAVVALSHASASAQQAELGEVRLLGAPDAPAQSAVFEIGNKTDHEISSLAVSCQLLNDAGKAVAVKVVRLRHLPPGSVIGDAAFPTHVRGGNVTCHIVHQTSQEKVDDIAPAHSERPHAGALGRDHRHSVRADEDREPMVEVVMSSRLKGYMPK